MTESKALKILEKMPEDQFQAFFKSLPKRVTMLVKAGFVDWRKVLPQWYIKEEQLLSKKTKYSGSVDLIDQNGKEINVA